MGFVIPGVWQDRGWFPVVHGFSGHGSPTHGMYAGTTASRRRMEEDMASKRPARLLAVQVQARSS